MGTIQRNDWTGEVIHRDNEGNIIYHKKADRTNDKLVVIAALMWLIAIIVVLIRGHI